MIIDIVVFSCIAIKVANEANRGNVSTTLILLYQPLKV